MFAPCRDFIMHRLAVKRLGAGGAQSAVLDFEDFHVIPVLDRAFATNFQDSNSTLASGRICTCTENQVDVFGSFHRGDPVLTDKQKAPSKKTETS